MESLPNEIARLGFQTVHFYCFYSSVTFCSKKILQRTSIPKETGGSDAGLQGRALLWFQGTQFEKHHGGNSYGLEWKPILGKKGPIKLNFIKRDLVHICRLP